MVVLIKIILPFYQNFKRVSAEDMIFFTNYSFLPASPANITPNPSGFALQGLCPALSGKDSFFRNIFFSQQERAK